MVYEWYIHFQESHKDTEDDNSRILAHQLLLKTWKIKDIMLSNCQITIRKTAEEVDISYRSCKAIFTNVLGMKQVVDKFVSKL